MNLADKWLSLFEAKVSPEPNSGCWIWTGALSSSGYGSISKDKRIRSAHSAAYEFFVGSVPDGLELDHLCHTKLCCNPQHLEPVTRSENLLRRPKRERAPVPRTCRNGHVYTLETLVIRERGNRECRECMRESNRRSRRRVAIMNAEREQS